MLNNPGAPFVRHKFACGTTTLNQPISLALHVAKDQSVSHHAPDKYPTFHVSASVSCDYTIASLSEAQARCRVDNTIRCGAAHIHRQSIKVHK
jgi:hypothetical protein